MYMQFLPRSADFHRFSHQESTYHSTEVNCAPTLQHSSCLEWGERAYLAASSRPISTCRSNAACLLASLLICSLSLPPSCLDAPPSTIVWISPRRSSGSACGIDSKAGNVLLAVKNHPQNTKAGLKPHHIFSCVQAGKPSIYLCASMDLEGFSMTPCTFVDACNNAF